MKFSGQLGWKRNPDRRAHPRNNSRRRHRNVVGVSVIAFALALSAPFGLTAETEKVAIIGARLIDGQSDQVRQDVAVVIEGEVIVAVGGPEIVPEDARVIDLGSATILPGLIDTHMHMLPMMVFSGGLVMPNEGDPDKMLAQLKEYVANNPDGPFYSFGGAFEGTVPISRQQIDEIISDKPFLMMGQGGHGGWANTRALEMSGIEAGKEDPVDYWERDDKGHLTGYVGTSPAIWLMVKRLNIIQKETMVITAPRTANRACPYRSESVPLIGPTIKAITDTMVNTRPAFEGGVPIPCSKKNGISRM